MNTKIDTVPVKLTGCSTQFPCNHSSVDLAVIWIDWYAYHVARFRALAEHPKLRGRVAGIELVGGSGVHQGMQFRSEERDGLSITTLLPDTDWSQAGQWRLAALLWRRLDELNPAALLIPGYYTAPALAAVLWGKRHRKRTILMSETTREDHDRVWWKEAVKSRLLPTAFDAAIAGGERQRSYLKDLGFRENQLGRYYDVADNQYYERGAALWRKLTHHSELKMPERYFLYVGRLAPEKNVDGLIRAFTRFRREGECWSLVVVGDGPQSEQLCEQVRAEGMAPWVHFVGLKRTPEILPFYAFAACFVLPSRREPWGLVVNEAMAAGLPVIVSKSCGCADDLVENGGNGFVFDPDRENELTEHMFRLALMNRQRRQEMGDRSQYLILRYSPERWAEEVIRFVDPKFVSYSPRA